MKITDEAVEAFAQYRRSQIAELRPWQPGDDMSGVSVSAEDEKEGSPKIGDMIARNPKNHADQWLVAAAYFADNFEPVAALPHLSTEVESVKITDEAVEAMLTSWFGTGYQGNHMKEGRAALEAALPHMSGVTVKPLEWKVCGRTHEHAYSILGDYFAYDDGSWTSSKSHHMRSYGHIESAKAEAQADFERRILSSLSPAPVGDVHTVHPLASHEPAPAEKE